MNIEILSLSEAMSEFNLIVAIALIIIYGFVQAIESSLTFSLTQHKSLKAANTTFILYIIWGIEIFALISNYLYIIPIAIGAWIGSYLTVENEKKKRPQSNTNRPKDK